MTNPDNVGGLPVFVSSDIERLLSDAYACGMNGDPFDMLNARRVIDKSVHAYAELCRAAPAGGDRRAMYRTAVEKVLFPNGRKIEAEGEIYDERDVEPEIRHEFKDSATAGSGEVDEFMDGIPRALELADRLIAAGPKAAHVSASETHEISEFVHDAAALLRKLQQGADYVMVPREPTEAMRAAFTAESMPGFAAMTTIRIGDFGERYRYMIAASQGQEGGK